MRVHNHKDLKKGDIISRPASAGMNKSVMIYGVMVRGIKMDGDMRDRRYEVLAVGNCGRLWLEDLENIPGNILGCIRFKDISTFEVYRPTYPIYGHTPKLGEEVMVGKI